jgi:hypothetical protein
MTPLNQHTKKKIKESGRQYQLFLNVASGRFPSIRAAGIAAGFRGSSLNAYVQKLVKDNEDYIKAMREEYWADFKTQVEKDGRLAHAILRQIMTSGDNDNVRRTAAESILELAGMWPDRTKKKPVEKKPLPVSPQDIEKAMKSLATKAEQKCPTTEN